MRQLFLILVYLLTVTGHAETPNELDVMDTAHIGGYFMGLKTDCTHIYFEPLDYQILADRSTVQNSWVLDESGVRDEVKPVMTLQLVLTPLSITPSAAVVQKANEWAQSHGTVCSNRSPQFQPYPSALTQLKYQAPSRLLNSVNAQINKNREMQIQFSMNPIRIPTKQVQHLLNGNVLLRAESIIFQKVPEISVTLNVEQSAIANFAMNHYTEMVCSRRERCAWSWGIKLFCHTENHCENMPRTMKVFRDLNLSTHVETINYLAPGVPEYKLEQAREQLFSEFLLASFESNQTELAVLLTVDPGKMTKSSNRGFHKSLITYGFNEKTVVSSLSFTDPEGKFTAEVLKRLNSTEIVCLQKSGRDLNHITNDDPCFRHP